MAQNYCSWLLRYVPDAVRGEFVNIGVVVGRNEGDWAVRLVESFARANRLGGNAAMLRPALRSLRERIEAANGAATPQRPGLVDVFPEPMLMVSSMEELAARYNNALQISETRAAYGDSAADLASMLFTHLVLSPESQRHSRARTQMRNDFASAVSRYRPDLVDRLIERPTAQIGLQRQQFDFAVGQDSIDQMANVISITRKDQDLVHQEINAWNYSVRLIRDNGAVVLSRSGNTQMQMDRSVPIMLVHDRPTTPEQQDLLEMAREGWRNLGVQDVDRSSIAQAVQSVRHLIAS